MSVLKAIWLSPITRIVLYFAGVFAVVIVVGSVYSALHPKPKFAVEMIGGGAVETLAAVSMLAVMARFVDKRPLSTYGFAAKGIASETFFGYMIGSALISVAVGYMQATGHYHVLGRNPAFHVVVPLLSFLFIGIGEETMFRGYAFTVLERRWGSGVALLATSLFFGLAHLLNHVPGITGEEKLFSALAISVEAGLLLGAAYMLTRRLWVAIGIHWAWNFFEGPFYGTSVSGTGSGTSFLLSKMTGGFFATGGPFGPEGGLPVLIVCTIAGLLMLRAAIKNGQWRSGEPPLIPAVLPEAPAEEAEIVTSERESNERV